jgi:hypothetical protein
MIDKTKTAFPWAHGDAGMTLRDYFAAKAMQGIAARQTEEYFFETVEDLANAAYAHADAMLKARGE